MRYAGINKNDFSAAPGTCVTFFTQGCPHRCAGCHNPETWDFNGGKEFTVDTLQELLTAMTANGIHRDLCIMGGEPLCPENQFLTKLVIKTIKDNLPDTKVYIWSGYTYAQLQNNDGAAQILELCDVLIDGPFVMEERDVTLFMRGSTNQKIINLKENI